MAELYVVISSYMIIKTSKQRTAAACAHTRRACAYLPTTGAECATVHGCLVEHVGYYIKKKNKIIRNESSPI